MERLKKLGFSLTDKKKCTHKNLKKNHGLNHGLVLQVHRVITFNQKAWLKPFIDINKELKKSAKNDFGKGFFKLMRNAVFV